MFDGFEEKKISFSYQGRARSLCNEAMDGGGKEEEEEEFLMILGV